MPPRGEAWEAILHRHPDILEEGSQANLLIRRWRQKEQKFGKPQSLPRKVVRKGLHMINDATKLTEKMRITHAVRQGLPPERRGEFWYVCSGASELQVGSPPDEYVRLSAALIPERTLTDIDKDIQRTSTNPEIQQSEAVKKMRRLLIAFAARNPTIGYCQSMNFVACMLLLHLDEEPAFWVLCALVEHLLPEAFYEATMLGVRTEKRVLDGVLQEKLPGVWRHLEDREINLETVVYNWLLCLYVNTLPLEATLRVWDVLFNEGPKILIRVAVGLFFLHKQELLMVDDDADVFMVLKHPFGSGGALDAKGPRAEPVPSADDLMAACFSKHLFGSLSRARLERFRGLARDDLSPGSGGARRPAPVAAADTTPAAIFAPEASAHLSEPSTGGGAEAKAPVAAGRDRASSGPGVRQGERISDGADSGDTEDAASHPAEQVVTGELGVLPPPVLGNDAGTGLELSSNGPSRLSIFRSFAAGSELLDTTKTDVFSRSALLDTMAANMAPGTFLSVGGRSRASSQAPEVAMEESEDEESSPEDLESFLIGVGIPSPTPPPPSVAPTESAEIPAD